MRGGLTFDSRTVALLKQFLNKDHPHYYHWEEALTFPYFMCIYCHSRESTRKISSSIDSGILRVDDGRTFPTLKTHDTTCTDCLFISTSSSESNLSLNDWHNVILGRTRKTPSVVGPFLFSRDSMSWEEDREIPVRLSAEQSITGSLMNRPMVCTGAGQVLPWTHRTSSWFCASIIGCKHPTLMLTLKDQAIFLFIKFSKIVKVLNPPFPKGHPWIALCLLPLWKPMIWDTVFTPHGNRSKGIRYLRSRIVLGELEKNHVRHTRIAEGRLPSWQMELSSLPNSFPPLLTCGVVHTSPGWGTEPLCHHDVVEVLCFLTDFSFISEQELRSLHGIV